MSKLGLEVLAPAGDPEIFTRVIDAGADAVYFGGSAFGARAYATNFTLESAEASIRYAHARGKKAYLTVNTLLKNLEMEKELYPYLKSYYEMGLDAVIVQDYGVFTMVRDCFPDLALHCSTQMSLCTPYGASFLQEQGAHRVVTAREISLEEIREIYDATGMEIETFVHGALCVCYSGQCLMSSMIGGRSGNRGRCAQPCRLNYDVMNTNGKKMKLPGAYPISPKDLCGVADLPALSEAGVYSLKIEGRMKQGDYAEGVVSVYRKYVDRFLSDPKAPYRVEDSDMEILLGLGNRNGFTNSYYYKRNETDLISFTDSAHRNQKMTDSQRKEKCRLDIRGSFRAALGEPMELTVSTMDGAHTCIATGAVVEAAKNQGATEASIQKQLNKSGNTPYVFRELRISCEDGVFLPNALLNELRRDALEQLEAQMVQVPHKEALPLQEVAHTSVQTPLLPGTFVTVRSEEQLSVVLKKAYITYVGLDTSLTLASKSSYIDLVERIHASGKKAVFLMPAIFRKNTYPRVNGVIDDAVFDYYMATTMDSLGFLKERLPGAFILADARLYTYSDRTQDAFGASGIAANTIPYELNRGELQHRKNENSFFTVYGYTPLMYMANCTHKNCQGCDHVPGRMILRDRYGNPFTMVNSCEICTNILYNYLPTNLIGEADASTLRALGDRLDFTLESAKDVEVILKQYETKSRDNTTQAYTKGHYGRGVE